MALFPSQQEGLGLAPPQWSTHCPISVRNGVDRFDPQVSTAMGFRWRAHHETSTGHHGVSLSSSKLSKQKRLRFERFNPTYHELPMVSIISPTFSLCFQRFPGAWGMVVGHTAQADGRVHSRCQGRLVLGAARLIKRVIFYRYPPRTILASNPSYATWLGYTWVLRYHSIRYLLVN